MRAIANSFLAALVILALFLGNCFSCPQVLLSLSGHTPHGCCHRNQPVKKECQTQVLRHFVKADPGNPAPSPILATAAPVFVAVPAEFIVRPLVAACTPPDLLSLQTSLRV